MPRLAAAWLCLLTCALPARADDAPQNTKPFTRYKVLLDGILNDTLPFDVHFIIWGDVPQNAERVRLRRASVQSPGDCSTAAGDVAEYVAKAVTWTQTDYTDRGLTAPGDITTNPRKQFEMVIDPVEHSRFYCFVFQVEPGRQITADEHEMLARRLFPAYQKFLSDEGVVEAIDESAMNGLRRALIAALLSASPLQGFTAEPGSVFDANAPFKNVAAQFGDMVTKVFNEHNDVVNGMQRVDGLGQDGSARLSQDVAGMAAWSTSPVFKKFAAALPQPEGELFQRFVRLSVTEREQYLLGRQLGGGDGQLREQWEADPVVTPCPSRGQLASRCGALGGRQQELEPVRTILGKIGGPEATTLSTAIADTIEDLGDRIVEIQNVQQAINDREEVLRAHLRLLNGRIPEVLRATVTTIGNLQTRRGWYASMDTGLAVAPWIEEVFPYVGTNIYFRPVNREAPPRAFLTRFSSLLGFTWTSNLKKTGVRQPLYGSDAMLVLGAGMRFTNLLRVNGGVLLLKGVNPNPVVSTTRLEVTPFFSLSGDIDLAGLLGGLFGASAKPPTLGAGTPPR